MDKYLIALVVTVLIASLWSENYACKNNSKTTSNTFNDMADRLSVIEPEDDYSRESITRMIEWREKIGRRRHSRSSKPKPRNQTKT